MRGIHCHSVMGKLKTMKFYESHQALSPKVTKKEFLTNKVEFRNHLNKRGVFQKAL